MIRQILFFASFFILALLSFSSIQIFSTLLGIKGLLFKYLKIISIAFPFIIALAIFLGQYFDSLLVRIFYTKIMILTGIMFYIFLFAVFIGILLLADKIFNFNWNWNLIAQIGIIVTLILSIIGTIQSLFIKTTTYTINNSLENLPFKKIVLISDTHFGLINQNRLSKKIVEKILKINPDLILLPGDFFDGPNIELGKIMKEWKKLTKKIPVYYSPGNHEEYGPYLKFINSLKDINFKVLEDKSENIENVQIIGLKYRTKDLKEETKRILENISDPKAYKIILNHSPIFQEESNSIGAFLQVSGHSHKGQFWPLGYIVKTIYGKNYYGIHKYKNLTQITTSGVGTASVPFRTFNTPEIVIINFK